MIIYSIGLLTGITLSILVLIGIRYFRPEVERTIREITAKAERKGTITEPENDELEEWKDSLPTE